MTIRTNARTTRADVRFCVVHPYARPDGYTITEAHADRHNRWVPFSYHVTLKAAVRRASRVEQFFGAARVVAVN